MKKQVAVLMSTAIAANAIGNVVSIADSSVESNKEVRTSIYPDSQMLVKSEEFMKDKNNWDGPDVIEDDNLRFMINSRYNREGSDEELRKLPVTKEMVKNLRILSPEQWKPHDSHEVDFMLKSLKGLEYAENLEWLSLVNQQESSLEPLKNCKKLKHLDMRNNDKITDISPLSNLVNLEELDMRSVKCGNIEALSNCKKLRSLIAFSCGIKDLKPLENLLNLEYLEIEFNEFEDVSALKNLTNLKYLDISKLGMKYDIFGNKNPTVKSIAALEKLVNLEFLSISSNDIKDLTPLKNMNKLRHLGAANNLIDDWSPIYNLGNKLLTVHSQGNDAEYDSSKIVAKTEDGKSDQIFDLLEVVNPEKIKVRNKNEALSKLPKKVFVKIRKHDDSKPVYTEGIYNKATIRYIVKDEDGKIISAPLSFSANTIDSKEYGYINSISKDGYVDFVANGIAKEMKVDLNSNDYELVGSYKFKENTCTEGYHIDWVEKMVKL